MAVVDQLRYFRRDEFTYPGNICDEILRLVDEIRHIAGIPIRITSDFRTPADHSALYPDGGPNSPHLRGTAIDFRPVPFNADTRLRVLAAICGLYASGACPRLGLEIADKHFHLDVDYVLRRPHLWLGESR